MDKEKKLINTFKLGDEKLSNELLTSIFEQINSKLDDIKEDMAEMKNKSEVTNLTVDNKLNLHDVRIKVLEDAKNAHEKLPLKNEIGNKVFSAAIFTIGACIGLSIFIAGLSAFNIPVVSVIKALFAAIGAGG